MGLAQGVQLLFQFGATRLGLFAGGPVLLAGGGGGFQLAAQFRILGGRWWLRRSTIKTFQRLTQRGDFLLELGAARLGKLLDDVRFGGRLGARVSGLLCLSGVRFLELLPECGNRLVPPLDLTLGVVKRHFCRTDAGGKVLSLRGLAFVRLGDLDASGLGRIFR